MEKRLVIFLVLSVLILFGHVVVRSVFFPPQREVAQKGDPNDPKKSQPQRGDKGKTPEGQKPEGQKPEENGTGDSTGKAKPQAGDSDPDVGPASKDVPSDVTPESGPDPAAAPEEWIVLGSYDPKQGGRLLVTFSSRGASIIRVELVERDDKGRLRYRDLIRTYGYLGLDTRDTRQGCQVKIVRPGTPADLATPAGQGLAGGFKADDVILRAGEQTVGSSADLDELLSETKPGSKLTFEVQRDTQKIQLTASLEQWPLQLIQPETPEPNDILLGHPDGLVLPAVGKSRQMIPSYLLGLRSVGSSKTAHGQVELDGITSLRTSTWEISQPTAAEVVFSKRIQVSEGTGEGELEFVKRFKMLAANTPGQNAAAPATEGASASSPYAAYHLEMDIEIRNHGTEAQTISYAMDGPNGLPLEGWWYTNKIHPSWGSAGARDVVWRVNGGKHSLRSATQICKQAKEAIEEEDPASAVTSILTDNPTEEERTLDYLGVDTQFFSAVMRAGSMNASQPFACDQTYSVPLATLGEIPELSGRGMKGLNTTYRMVSVAAPIEPGTPVVDKYYLFLGPKSTEVLAAYDLADMIEYGWFGKISRPLAWLLHLFYGLVRNYGLAIVILTVMVRGAMFPIGRKAARNAQVMQELAPEIKKIKEKYKNDLEKQGQAQRELWRQHNFNPLSGCWLMFLQLPIFIGLYRCLSVDIQLRQAPLIPGLQWCSNLAGPDMAWRWQGIVPDFFASETGWLGPYLNVLPIITIVLFIAQQKMFTPPATDDQTRMQQSMMKYMMIFMGVLFFKVPAGLCVYFIASSLWGIGERKLLPKPGANAGSQPAPTKGPPPPEKKSWLERMREKAEGKTPEPRRKRPKRRK